MLLNLLGAVIALYRGVSIDIGVLLWGQVVITATQWMTHYANDYYDLEADRANHTPTNWSGGSRILVERRVQPVTARNIALIFATIAFLGNIILSTHIESGLLVFAILLSAQGLSWFYSAPPLRLHSSGLGEVVATFTVCVLTPIVGFVLQSGYIDPYIFIAIVPLLGLQFAMLLAVEFPDVEGDRLSGKRTLVVRMGGYRASRLYCYSIIASFVSLPFLILVGLPYQVALPMFSLLPIALILLWRVRRGDWQNPNRWNGLAFYSIVLLILMMLVELGGFLLLSGFR